MFQEVQLDNVRAVRFDYVKAVLPKPFAGGWVQLFCRLSISKETRQKDRRALWSPVIYAPGTTRANRNVEAVTCLVVDMDGEAFDNARLDGLEYMAYTTWSHRSGDEHWHLVLPLKDPVPADRWAEVWTSLHERINVVGDPATKDPARIFYLPQHQYGREPGRRYGYGKLLDAELGELFVAPRMRVSAMPKAAQSPKRHFAFTEEWWTEPADLSRFDGLTQDELHRRLRTEWRELTKDTIR